MTNHNWLNCVNFQFNQSWLVKLEWLIKCLDSTQHPDVSLCCCNYNKNIFYR